MGQQLRDHAPDADQVWLSTLVQTFDRAERLHDVPCDEAAMRAVRAQLMRPTATALSAYGFRTERGYSPASCNRGR